MRSSARRIALAAVLLSACGHAEPFGSTPERNEGPLTPGNPAQITHNVFQDVRPSWLPDGSGILYTFQKSPVENSDQCLAILPPDGGTHLAQLCSNSVGHLDSTEVYRSSAISTTGQLAYSYAQSTQFQLAPEVTQLRVAPLTNPQDFTVVHSMPLDVEGTKVDGIGDLHWLSDTRLVYLAQAILYTSSGGATRDTTIKGLAVALIDLQNSPAPVLVPGTMTATAVSPGEAPETIIYTLAGDSRVYRRELVTGITTVLHDFGFSGIARDAVVHDGQLLAIVGGFVIFGVHPVLGGIQTDLGGPMYQVDLGTGQQDQLPDGGLRVFRHPAISPTGAVAVESYPVTVEMTPAGTFTNVSAWADLMLFEAP
jgi:hypothetical protein